jgi:hypothetical protein
MKYITLITVLLILAIACNSNKPKAVLRMPEIRDTNHVSVVIPGDVSQEPYMVSKGKWDSDMQAIADTLEKQGIKVYCPGHDPHVDRLILRRLPEIISLHPKTIILLGDDGDQDIPKDSKYIGPDCPLNSEGRKIIKKVVESYYDTTNWHPLLYVCDTCKPTPPSEGEIWYAPDGHYYTIRNGKTIEMIPQGDKLQGFFSDDTAFYHRIADSLLSKKP